MCWLLAMRDFRRGEYTSQLSDIYSNQTFRSYYPSRGADEGPPCFNLGLYLAEKTKFTLPAGVSDLQAP